jgi:hypothetical protein
MFFLAGTFFQYVSSFLLTWNNKISKLFRKEEGGSHEKNHICPHPDYDHCPGGL